MNGYLVLPSCERPKYLLPLHPRALFSESLGLYTAFAVKRRIQLGVLRLLNMSGSIGPLMQKRIISEDRLHEFVPHVGTVLQWVRTTFNSESAVCAFLCTTVGKVVVQVMDERVGTIGYVKAAGAEPLRQRLAHEHRTLFQLSRASFRHIVVPQIIHFQEVGDLSFLAMTSPAQAVAHQGTLHLATSHVRGLVELFKSTLDEASPSLDACFKTLTGRVEQVFQNYAHQGCARRMQTLLGRLAGAGIPLGLCHSDFKPWNLCHLSDGRLYIFDWELARQKWLPLWDVFHFLLQPAILVRKTPVNRLARMLLRENGPITLYMRTLGVSQDLYGPLLLCYLLDVIGQYQPEVEQNHDPQAIFFSAQAMRLSEYLLSEVA